MQRTDDFLVQFLNWIIRHSISNVVMQQHTRHYNSVLGFQWIKRRTSKYGPSLFQQTEGPFNNVPSLRVSPIEQLLKILRTNSTVSPSIPMIAYSPIRSQESIHVCVSIVTQIITTFSCSIFCLPCVRYMYTNTLRPMLQDIP